MLATSQQTTSDQILPMRLFFPLMAALSLVAVPATSHEFWIAPEKFQVENGAPVVAHLRNGEMFKGGDLAWFPHQSARTGIILNGREAPYEGRMGDIPALSFDAPDAGLLTLLTVSVPAEVKYKSWEKFLAFTADKGMADIPARHLARGLPQQDFWERYTRHVKALIAVGHGMGADTDQGMTTEILALANPYTDALPDGLPVRLLLDGAPRTGAQIEIFAKAPDGTVTRSVLHTDTNGEARVPVAQGHSYLLDAVTIRPLQDDGRAVWETLWATLVLALPAR